MFISSGPRSMPMCSYSSRIGHPSTISYSLTICFLILFLYCPLLAELTIFCSSVSLFIWRPEISCLQILMLMDYICYMRSVVISQSHKLLSGIWQLGTCKKSRYPQMHSFSMSIPPSTSESTCISISKMLSCSMTSLMLFGFICGYPPAAISIF